MCHILKPTHTDQFMWSGSHHPQKHKLYIIRTLHHKANNVLNKCNIKEQTHQECSESLWLCRTSQDVKSQMSSNNTQNKNIVACFPEDKLSRLLMVFPFGASVSIIESSVIVANESLSCPRCENMDLKIIQSLLERVQIHKIAVN